MTAVLADGLQIVPGYRLESPLGKGGFGEVWRAIGPGKVPVALKIIAAKGSQTGEREFKSLSLLRDLRHPNLLPVQAYWLLDDDGKVIEDDRPPSSIVIAMLLGGKNLRQRLDECRKAGMAGIPPRELLEYFRDAAKGIDYLNKPIHQLADRVVAIQHRDIKPENLMIVGGGVMVADFGIAGVMESDRAHTTNAAMTFNYAAPELFDYTATAWTDQYALAISYGELRCGSLPFPPHSSPMHVIRIHTEGRHDFSRLSPGEQAVLKRATSLVPEQRYPTCQEMLAELDAAVRAANLLDEVVPLSDAADQSNIPTELQATRLERGADTDPSTVPTVSSVAVVPGLSASELSKAKTTPLGNITEPVQIPVTQQESVPLYAMPATAPFGGSQHQPPRSRKSRWIEASVCVIVVAGLIIWSLSGGVRQSNSPGVVTNLEPSANDSPTNSVASGTSATEEKPLPVNRLAAARELAATAAKEKRYADVVKALDPVFEQASATTDDYVMCGNSCLALADAGEMPAENYARAAADFEKADLPREQQRALTRQGRWLIDHNFPKLAIAPLRQAIGLKKSSELQLVLSQALLAMNDAKAARDEAIIGLVELPQDSSSDADLATAARLHYVLARTCLVLAKPIATNPEMAKELEQFDVEAEQHFREALVRAISSKLDEHATWQDEFSAFQKLPRMLARVERRQRKEKIVELNEALEQSPNAAAQWIELAELEKLDGQTKSAATHFARGFGLQAMELARTGKLDEASKAEAKAAEHEADSVQVQYARALIAAGQGRHKDAVTLFDSVLSRSPQLPPLGDNESPSTAHQTLARLHHDRATALETLAVQENSKPDLTLLEQAEKAFATASSLAPNEPRYALSSGQNLLRQARSSTLGYAEMLDRAAIILTTATKLDQQQAEAHFALGDCQFLRGKSAEAQAAFDQAVELAAREPIERQFQFSLSQSLAYLRAPRNDTKALAAADRAILLQRSAPAAHFARGLALRNLKRTNEAIAAFNDSLAAQPKHVGALIARSQLLIEHDNATAKQLDQAQQDIEVALAAAATDELKAEAFYVRSLAALKTHVSNVTQAATAEPALLKAQRDLLQAVKLMPSNTVFSQAATELFDYAAKVTWSDSQRKADSDSLQRDWKSARRQK